MNLKEKLKEALRKEGLNEELADLVAITEEAQIEGIVTKLKPQEADPQAPDFSNILSSEAFSKYVSENGFQKVLETSKALQSEHDKKVQAGIKTFSEKYFKKLNNEDEEEDKTKQSTKDGEQIPAWAKALVDGLNEIKQKEQKQAQASTLNELLSKSKLTSGNRTRWANRVDLNSNTTLEEQVKALEKEQDDLTAELYGNTKGLPTGGQPSKAASNDEIDSVVNNLI